MQITIQGILYETAIIYEGGIHTPVLIPVSDQQFFELAKEGKILLASTSLSAKEWEMRNKSLATLATLVVLATLIVLAALAVFPASAGSSNPSTPTPTHIHTPTPVPELKVWVCRIHDYSYEVHEIHTLDMRTSDFLYGGEFHDNEPHDGSDWCEHNVPVVSTPTIIFTPTNTPTEPSISTPTETPIEVLVEAPEVVCQSYNTGRVLYQLHMTNTDPLHYGYWLFSGKEGICQIVTDGSFPNDQVISAGCECGLPNTFRWTTTSHETLYVWETCDGTIFYKDSDGMIIIPYGSFVFGQYCSAAMCPYREHR
jgi:hypothetical protein